MAAFGAAPAAGSSVENVNAPATCATGSKDKAFSKWKPRPMPKPTPEDYFIVIKPRESVSLHEAFTETGYGTAISAYLGLKRARAAPAAGSSVENVNAPATCATGSKDKAFSKWKPRPMPKPTPEDYVIVIKPRESVSLHEAFTETGYGTAISAYLGLKRARAISVLPSREQNLIIVHTPDIEAADQLIGDFAVNSDNVSIPLRGYLRQDGGNMCHGVIVVRNSDTTETLKDRVCWRAGTILEIRKFGTSNKARITFAAQVLLQNIVTGYCDMKPVSIPPSENSQGQAGAFTTEQRIATDMAVAPDNQSLLDELLSLTPSPPPSEARPLQKKRKHEPFHEELEQVSAQIRNNTPQDVDEHFTMSLMHHMRRVKPERRIEMQLRVLQVP
ncbi:hypothetical protein V5799_010688 [Amblyomma americanum]|uniref:BESS domain-containing protein n=1 Tax=Amblyomma americanum TaxID=6943 RepID=A0AAQ4EJ63_AMBAM